MCATNVTRLGGTTTLRRSSSRSRAYAPAPRARRSRSPDRTGRPSQATSMLRVDDGTTLLPAPVRRPARAPARRLRDRQGRRQRVRVHLRGVTDRALHVLQEPQLPLRGPRAAPRPVLAAVLEGERQDDLAAVIRRGHRDLPGMDHRPPPPRSRARADARPLPTSRRADPRQPRPTLPRPHTSTPAAPLSHLNAHETRGHRDIPGFCAPKITPQRAESQPITRNFPLVLK